LVGNQEDVVYNHHFDQLNGEQGFVFAPFSISEENPVIVLKPGRLCIGYEGIAQLEVDQFQPMEYIGKQADSNCILTKDEYLKTIGETISEIKNGAFSKVIISRKMPVQRGNEALGCMFSKLQEQTPNAFCYLVNLPFAGTWMGATPELLLRQEGDTLETVSLAGTQTRRDDGDYAWNTKEIEEQAFVSRYLLDVFYRFNIDSYKTEGPDSMESGQVAHLKTSFFFPLEKISSRLGDFIAELHPTPAVCGLPKKQSGDYILAKEKHHRNYYTGFLGPWKLNNELRLFVNLRCMKVFQDQYILYAGGGITAKSVPEKEWDETNQKAGTLLSVINKCTE